MRITSAPSWAIVMPPSGAATKAENSTMRRSSSSRFIAAPRLSGNPGTLSRSWTGAAIPGCCSRTEDNRVHDPAGEQGEGPGDHQRADEQTGHRPAMSVDLMSPGAQDGKRQHDQREHRQQMNGAPWPPQPDLMDEERGTGHDEQQRRPDPTEDALRDRPLWRGELDRAERKGPHR